MEKKEQRKPFSTNGSKREVCMMETTNQAEITQYRNCTQVKFDNRLISVEPLDDGCFGIRIDIKDNIDNPRTKHVYKDGVTTTLMKLTKEAGEALAIALQNEINRLKDE